MSFNKDEISEETMNKLENASKEEAKNIIIDLITPQCRGVAKSFFDCVEQKTQNLNIKDTNTYGEFEKLLNDTMIPDCMKLYDLDGCLKIDEERRNNNQ